TGDKSAAHRIYCACHDDGNGLGRTPRCRHRRPCPQYNDIDVLAYKLGGKVGKKLEPPFCEAPFHAEVFSLHQSDLPHASQKAAIDAGCQNRRPRSAGKKPHAPDFCPLLRARRERPRESRAAEQRDELAPLHSITSSAMASMPGGIVRPSILAVLRLITSSNLVGCRTGKSAGLAPLRILPV